MVEESSCEKCKKVTKELFTEGSTLVCEGCRGRLNRTRGSNVEAKPPTGTGRGVISETKSPLRWY